MPTYGFGSTARRLEDIDENIRDGFRSGSRRGLQFTERLGKVNATTKDAIAFGRLVGFEWPIRADSDRQVSLTVPMDYAKFVESGTGSRGAKHDSSLLDGDPYDAPRFGDPLIRGIQGWLKAKGMSPTEYRTRTELAVAISASIARDVDAGGGTGTKAQPFLEPAWDRSQSAIVKEVKRNISRSI